jgi:hypothetical protein
VHDELERLRVDLADRDVEPLDLGIGVGHVAEEREGGGAGRDRRERRAAD